MEQMGVRKRSRTNQGGLDVSQQDSSFCSDDSSLFGHPTTRILGQKSAVYNGGQLASDARERIVTDPPAERDDSEAACRPPRACSESRASAGGTPSAEDPAR